MKAIQLGSGAALVLLLALGCAAETGSTDRGSGSGTGGFVAATGGAVGTGGVVGGTGAVTGTGGVVSGTGGVVSGTGGVVSGTGGGATAVTCTGAATSDGYMDNGTLCGYAWTSAYDGAEIDPPCGSGACFTGAEVCASGTIPANSTVYPGAMIGWNVAQASGSSTSGTWTATGSGITVNFTNGGATGEMRVLIQSGGTDYCAPNATSGQMIPWSGFTVGCWEAGGAAFSAGSAVDAIAVQINGSDAAQTFSNFCISSVAVN